MQIAVASTRGTLALCFINDVDTICWVIWIPVDDLERVSEECYD